MHNPSRCNQSTSGSHSWPPAEDIAPSLKIATGNSKVFYKLRNYVGSITVNSEHSMLKSLVKPTKQTKRSEVHSTVKAQSSRLIIRQTASGNQTNSVFGWVLSLESAKWCGPAWPETWSAAQRKPKVDARS